MFRSIARTLAFGVAVATLVAGTSCSILNDNLRPVEKDQFYRAGQMDGTRLDAVIDWHNVKTVINLRGASPDERWYQREIAACEKNGIAHRDLKLTMKAIPTPEALAQLVEWIETEQRPILVHCHAGVHRAGTASAVYELLRGKTVDDAREQFGLFFMNAPIGNLLDLYDGSKPFAEWVREDYAGIFSSTTEP